MRIRIFAAALCALLALASADAPAQSIATDERTPKLNTRRWLRDYCPPPGEYTYIGFVHSASGPCIESIRRIVGCVSRIDSMNVVVLTREPRERVGDWLYEYSSGRCGVSYGNERLFAEFGVNYAPFGVIVDRRRRALWFGNPAQLTEEHIREIISGGSDRARRPAAKRHGSRQRTTRKI